MYLIEMNVMCTVSKDFGGKIHRRVNKKTVAQDGVNERVIIRLLSEKSHLSFI